MSYYVPGLLKGAADATGRSPVKVGVSLAGTYATDSFYSPIWLLPLRGGTSPEDAPLSGASEEQFKKLGAWQAANGVLGQDQTLRLTISGIDDRPVILQSIQAVVDRRSAPLSGWYTSDRGCGGVVIREADIQLDKDPPSIRFSDGESSAGATPRLSLVLQVSRTDVEVIDVVAHTFTSTVDWHLEVRYTVGDRSGIVRVDNDGKPFRVSALTRGKALGYQLADNRLERTPGLDPGDGPVGHC